MIDHVSIPVADLAAACAFYETVLAAIGYRRLVIHDNTVAFGKDYPEFWLNRRSGHAPAPADSGHHIALRTRSTDQVDDFHAAALAAGGACDGPPGRRPEYEAGYYAAFIRDADGNRIEAVTFIRE